MINRICFPNLGLEFNINRVAFSVFGLEIYWYALIITAGIIAGYFYAVYRGKKQGISSDVFSDILLVGIPSAIICARLYYVVSKWEDYAGNPLEIFNLRAGGIAIYGAVIGAVAAACIYCRIKKQNTLKIFDICSLSLLIGQAVGRWGNFVNAEAYGYNTNSFLKMGIWQESASEYMYVHPTFLYESLWNICGFIVLSYMMKRKKADGQMFFLYIFWYGLGRFFIEGLRTDSLMAGNIRISQLVAAVSVVTGIVATIILLKKDKTNKAE